MSKAIASQEVLVELGILQRSGAGGRSTSYDLVRRAVSPLPKVL